MYTPLAPLTLCTYPVSGRPAVALRRPGPGPTLLLVHGAGDNHEVLRPFAEAWPGPVVSPSLPGRLGSEGPAPAHAEQAGAWLGAFAAAAGLVGPGAPPLLLAGHSYGGAVALAAVLGGWLEAAAVLLLASGAKLKVHPAILEAVREAAARGAPLPPFAAMGEGAPPTLVAAVEAARASTPLGSAAADWGACDAFDVRATVPALPAPLLALAGGEDPLTPPRYATWLAEHVPGATARILPGLGHMALVEAPEAVVAALASWLAARGLAPVPGARA